MKIFLKTNISITKLLTIAAAWLCIDFVVLGKFSYVATGDNAEITLPALISHASARFATGLWHVFSTSGNDRLALGFFGSLSEFVFKLLPGWLAAQVFSILQTLAALFGTYFLGRRLNLAPYASLFAAILYGISQASGVLVWSVYAYLPILLLILSKTLENKGNKWFWILLLFAGYIYSATAYMPFIMPFTLIVFIFWFCFVERRYHALDWLIIFCFSLFLALLRVQEYFAIGYYGLLSARHAEIVTYDTFVASYNTVFDFYFGTWNRLIITILAVYGLIKNFNTRHASWRLGASLLLATVFVIVVLAIKPLFVEFLELLRTYNLSRQMQFFEFIIVLCAGFGISRLWQDFETYRLKSRNYNNKFVSNLLPIISIIFLAILAVEQKVRHFGDWVTQGSYVNNFESPVIRKFAEKLNDNNKIYRATSFQMYPNYLNAYGIETVSGYQALNIKRFQEFWTRIIDLGKNEFPLAVPNEFFRLALLPLEHHANWPFDKVYNVNLLSLANVKYIFSRDRLSSTTLTEVHAPFKPWSALSTAEKIRTNISDNFFGRRHLYVYENENVFPRFFLAKHMEVYSSGEEVLSALASANIKSLRSTAYLEHESVQEGVEKDSKFGGGDIKLVHYTADKIILSLKLDGAALLVVTNSFSPYWRSNIDGSAANLFPVNHAFWGVFLPTEARKITFIYDPPY